jgi:hypothetical protein
MARATGNGDPLRVVSVSLGSPARDHAVEVELLGRRVSLERVGVDGNVGRACAMIAALDGHVAAIGLGGTDLYLVAGKRRYVLEQSRRLADSAKVTPVVDGSGLKGTLERETIRWLCGPGGLELRGKKVLLVCAVDRFGMAEALVEAGSTIIYGDLMFALGLPVPLRSLRTIGVLAALSMPIIRRLPISWIYPTGGTQERPRPKFGRFFRWADVIAGDFHFIHRYMPARLDGKTIITNTTTAEDVAQLQARGVSLLITTTPDLGGRSYGTNVMEAVMVALTGKRPEELRPEDYLDVLRRLDWKPRVVPLSTAPRPEPVP